MVCTTFSKDVRVFNPLVTGSTFIDRFSSNSRSRLKIVNNRTPFFKSFVKSAPYNIDFHCFWLLKAEIDVQ